MKIYLMGAEQPTNLRLMGDYPRVGMSFHSLRKRLPKKKAWSVADRYPGKEVYLSLGGEAVRKMSNDEFEEYQDDVRSFLAQHGHDFDLVTGIDDPRADYYPGEINYAPVWTGEAGISTLQTWAENYNLIALRATEVAGSPMLASQLAPLRNRHGVSWHLLDGARMEDLMSGRYQSAATIAWLSPMKNGETIVWDGVRMQRYPARMRDVARKRHRTLFQRAGFDPDLIENTDNYEEVTRFTVWSFAQMETYVDRKKPTTNPFSVVQNEDDGLVINTDHVEPDPEEPGTAPEGVDNSALAVRNEPNLPAKRQGPPRTMPGFDFETKIDVELDGEGNQVEVERLLAKKGSVPLRQCDTCHVQANCPAFQPQSECAYSLPIEIRTKDQLVAALAALVEQQMERVSFMYMQEQLNGGYADPNTSQEYDRLFNMIQKMKEINDNRDTIRMTVEAKTQSGVMSRLFGEQAKRLRELPEAVPTDIIEAQIVDDE